MSIQKSFFRGGLSIIFSIGFIGHSEVVFAKKKKEDSQPTSWVRKMDPPNINKDLPVLAPQFADKILAINKVLCSVQGKVSAPDFQAVLNQAGISVKTTAQIGKMNPGGLFIEVYAGSLADSGFLRISSHTLEGRWKSLVEFTGKNPMQLLPVRREEFLKISVDDDCVAEDMIRFNYDTDNEVININFIDADLFATRHVYQPYKALSEIYTPAALKSLGKTWDQVSAIAERKDRVLVTVYDSGVDYNHPRLAYKFLRPKLPMTSDAEAHLQKIRTELRVLRDQLEAVRAQRPINQVEIKQIQARSEALRTDARQYVVGWNFDRDNHLPFDFVYEAMNPNAQFSHHGTHVAGIVAKGSDDVAILPLRYAISGERDHFAAVKYAHEMGSRILNFSLQNAYQMVFESFATAMDQYQDMLFVVASGNFKKDLDVSPFWPAQYQRKNMIVVSAISATGEIDEDSNFSATKVDLAAVGLKVTSLAPVSLGGQTTYSGTSQAAPQVTRVAAKLKLKYPNITPIEIKDRLCRTADRTTNPLILAKVRCGILDEAAALRD